MCRQIDHDVEMLLTAKMIYCARAIDFLQINRYGSSDFIVIVSISIYEVQLQRL